MAGNVVRVGTQVTGVGKASSDLDRFRDKFDKLQKQGAKGFAIGAGAAITAKGLSLLDSAASAAFAEVGQMTQRASDLNESVSKSKVVFGEASAAVEAFGDTSADAFGISKQAAVEAAASFGNVFRGLDIGEREAATMSTTMVGLAGDLASFNNVGTDVALEKIRAGLAGEAEPLRAFGVLLNEAAVKAEAMEMGLVDANGEVSDGAKVQARYSLILKQTVRAQGDAARTGDELAGVNRRLEASVKDLEAALGQKLLPVQRDFTKLLLDEGIPAIENEAAGIEALIAGAERLAQKAKPAADGIAFLNAEMSENIDILADLITFWDGFAGKTERAAARAAGSAVDLSIAEEKAAVKARLMAAATEAAGDAVKGFGQQTSSTRRTVVRNLDDIADAFDKTWSELSGAADRAADDIFGPLERRAELAKLKLELAGAVTDLNAPQGKDETLIEFKERIAGARVELTGLQEDYFKLKAEMAGRGELSADALISFQRELSAAIRGATAEQATSLYALMAIVDRLAAKARGVMFGTGIRSGVSGDRVGPLQRAHGGPVQAGKAYVVGEKGPEVVVPNTAGTVIPNGGSGGSPVAPTGDGGALLAEARITNRLLSRVVAQEPHAARVMTARGQLARDSALMPGGRL